MQDSRAGSNGAELRRWLDQIADEFEAAWQRGEEPDPAQFLHNSVEPARRQLAIELVHLDLEWSRRGGKSRTLEHYAGRFPELVEGGGSLPAEIVEHFQSLGQDSTQGNGHASHPTARADAAQPVPPPGGDEKTLGETIQGRKLGRFVLGQPLGSGAFATVYRALDERLSRLVALKIPRSSFLADPQQRQRFFREARSAAGLNHPGIVPIYEIATQGDVTYLVSELVEGSTLQQVLAEGRLTFHEAARAIAQVAEALHYAHERGVIHRDVKPSNILIDAKGQARLTDFGLARVAADAQFTQEGQIIGTPAYMSPEQASGKLGDVDARSDVYSLGTVLYELLAGKRPFDGTMQVVLAGVLRGDPKSPRAINARIPRDLETICLKAISREPEKRYQAAGEMAADLRRFLSDQPIVARPPGLGERLVRLLRHYPITSVTALAAAVLAIAAGISWWRMPGTVLLSVQPVGAQMEIAGQSLVAKAEPVPVRLPSGVYRVHLTARDHADQWQDVYVGRGQTRSLQASLVHDEGTLDIDCEPRGAEIEIDGIPFGSRIRNLKRPTGTYTLQAASEGYMESPRLERLLGKGQVVTHRFWLDRGLLWRYQSPKIQGSLILVPDIDGDGAVDLAHNELGRIVVFSSVSGKILWETPLTHTQTSTFIGCNLGGDVGEVILTGREIPKESSQPGGIHLEVIRLGSKPEILWQWQGAPRDWKTTQGVSMTMVGDVTGDGVADLVVMGREPRWTLHSGKTGEVVREMPLPVTEPLGFSTIFWRPELPDRLIYQFAPFDPELEPQSRSPTLAGAVSLDSEQVHWHKTFQHVDEFLLKDLDGDEKCEIVATQRGRWEILDPRTGEVRWAGVAPGGAETRWHGVFTDLDGDRLQEVILTPPTGNAPLTAVTLDGGTVIWEGPTKVNEYLGSQGNSHFQVLRTRSGALLVKGPDALLALDPRSGRELWRHAGRPLGIIPGDWDGDGESEWFVTVAQRGLTCLRDDGSTLWTIRMTPEVAPLEVLPDADGDGLAEVVIHQGAAQLGVVRGPRVLWGASASGPLQATPLVTDDFTGDGRAELISLGPWSNRRNLVCLDGASGAVRWGIEIEIAPNCAPALADWDGDGKREVILMGHFTAKQETALAVFRGSDGKLMHSHKIDRQLVYSTPVASDLNGDGTLDVAFHRWDPRDVLAIDGRTGKSLWQFATQSMNYGGVAVADVDGDMKNDVVAPSLDGHVYALRGDSGEPIWSATLVDGSFARPAIRDLVDDGQIEVLVVSAAGRLHVFQGQDGSEVWSTSVSGAGRTMGRPAVAKAGEKELVITPFGVGGVAALDVAGKKVVWRAAETSGVTASPLVVDLDRDGLFEVVVGTIDGRLLVLDLASGRTLWSALVSGKTIEADPAVYDANGDGILDIAIADHDFQLTVLSGFATKASRRRKGL